MEKFYKIIDESKLSDGSKNLYKRQITKLLLKFKKPNYSLLNDTDLIKKTIEELYTNLESQKTIYNAIILIVKLKKSYRKKVYDIYKNFREIIIKQIKELRKENVITDEDRWMTLSELRKVPDLIKSDIEKEFGSFYLSRASIKRLDKTKRNKYIKLFLEYHFIYMHLMHPLRLDYFNIPVLYTKEQIESNEAPNTVQVHNGKLLLTLTKYKTHAIYGDYVKWFEDVILTKYVKHLEVIFGKKPDYLLYNFMRKQPTLFNSKAVYSHKITNLIKKYTGKTINMNTIRKIYETDLINSNKYKKLTNREQEEEHKMLLHSKTAALEQYNKVGKHLEDKEICECCDQPI
jgi:hypothetical protein